MHVPMFFLFGCARSGTTSLCNILDSATNATCLCEPNPQLHEETRRLWEGKLADPVTALKNAILPRALENLKKTPFYGEKNNNLGIFAPYLAQHFPCRLVFITRDGRDCVNSMHNWHSRMFGNFYREARNKPLLSARAQSVIDNLPVEKDLSDHSRPRPLPSDPWFEKWPEMTHHQMLCWYWNAWNMRLAEELEKLPSDCWIRMDYSARDKVGELEKVSEFLELEGLSRDKLEEMLAKRINSIKFRIGETEGQRSLGEWSELELQQFWEICQPAMEKLGYVGVSWE